MTRHAYIISLGVYKYTIVLVNVKRFRALCGFYAIQNKLLLLLLLLSGAYLIWLPTNINRMMITVSRMFKKKR